MTDVLLLAAVVGGAAVLAACWRTRDGRLRDVDEALSVAELALVGADPTRPLLLELTAPGCAPCAVARRVLDDVAAGTPVAVVAVDVGDVPDLARAHRVLRAPTVLAVAPGGRVRARVSGVPDAGELRAVLRELGVGAREDRPAR